MSIIKQLKNNSGSSKFILSRYVDDQDYYNIPAHKWLQVNSDEDIEADIVSGDLIVNNGVSDLSVSEGLDWLSKFETSNVEIDTEGRQISRVAAGRKGWTYIAHPIETTTSTVNGCYSSDYTGTARTDFEMKLYDVNGTEITTQGTADTDCVKTVITFKPLYNYEIISGNIFQKDTTTSDIRLWVIGGLFLESTNTPLSVKEFISGINFKYVGNDDHIETDGRASKMMTKDLASIGYAYPTYQGNCFQFIITHPAGIKHDLMTVLEYFRE